MNIGSRSTSGNVGNVIIESGVIEIIGFAVSMESLSLIVQFLAPMDVGILFPKTQISTSGLGRHIATTPMNSIKFFIPEVTVGIPLGIRKNPMHLSQRTWKISKIIAGVGGLLEAPLGRASVKVKIASGVTSVRDRSMLAIGHLTWTSKKIDLAP